MAGYVSSMIEYYDGYGHEVQKRYSYAMHEIKNGTYEPRQFAKDVLYVWSYGLLGLMPFGPAYNAVSPFGVPVMTLAIQTGKTTVSGTIGVNAPGASNPVVSPLLMKNGTKTITATAALDPGRTQLEVTIANLKTLTLAVGETYRGDVKLDGTPLVIIDVPVFSLP
jgi:hypothetical protein